VGVGTGVAALLVGAGVIAFVINQNAQNDLRVFVDASNL
jgi:hypothetical protein